MSPASVEGKVRGDEGKMTEDEERRRWVGSHVSTAAHSREEDGASAGMQLGGGGGGCLWWCAGSTCCRRSRRLAPNFTNEKKAIIIIISSISSRYPERRKSLGHTVVAWCHRLRPCRFLRNIIVIVPGTKVSHYDSGGG
jgi:hypothetical protein